MQRQDLTPSIFTITDVLTREECQELISFADRRGYEAATINAWDGPRLDKEMRNNDRVIVDDFDLAGRIWSRVEQFVPRMKDGRQVRGLNERFRYYRYTPGQRFSWHADAPFGRDNGELSLLTFMVYLNDGYEGGATQFDSLAVAGRQGMALLFEHGLIHEGAEVTAGIKYVVRSDVMYGPVGQFTGITLADRVARVRWHEYEQPEGNEPTDAAEALLAIWNATDARSSSVAYNQFLYAVGNNHAGTYRPVVMATLPFLAEILQTGSAMAQGTVLEVLGDLYGSFHPECVDRAVARDLEDHFRRSVRELRDIVASIAATSEANLKLAVSILELLDGSD